MDQGLRCSHQRDRRRHIGLAGKGKIVGNTTIKGRLDRESGLRSPALIEFTNCRHVLVEECFTNQNDMWSIHPVYCEDVTFRNVVVHGGADGIDIHSCNQVVMSGCEFVTGDDCISLLSGRGEEAYTLPRAAENVLITGCTFNDSHWACIGIRGKILKLLGSLPACIALNAQTLGVTQAMAFASRRYRSKASQAFM